jgi:DNA invertase Pin-like site-specific DNA recombinase
MFQMLGVFAEFERGIILERINAGLARTREKGTVLGRPRTTPAVEKRIRGLRGKGMGVLSRPHVGNRRQRRAASRPGYVTAVGKSTHESEL